MRLGIGSRMLSRVLVGKENHTWIIKEEQQEPIEELKIVEFVEGDTSKTTRIGITLSSIVVDHLSFLKENLDVFTWTREDMPGINRDIIEHCLNINQKKKLI